MLHDVSAQSRRHGRRFGRGAGACAPLQAPIAHLSQAGGASRIAYSATLLDINRNSIIVPNSLHYTLFEAFQRSIFSLARNQLQQRTLAGAIFSDQAKGGSFSDFERDVAQRPEVAMERAAVPGQQLLQAVGRARIDRVALRYALNVYRAHYSTSPKARLLCRKKSPPTTKVTSDSAANRAKSVPDGQLASRMQSR